MPQPVWTTGRRVKKDVLGHFLTECARMHIGLLKKMDDTLCIVYERLCSLSSLGHHSRIMVLFGVIQCGQAPRVSDREVSLVQEREHADAIVKALASSPHDRGWGSFCRERTVWRAITKQR